MLPVVGGVVTPKDQEVYYIPLCARLLDPPQRVPSTHPWCGDGIHHGAGECTPSSIVNENKILNDQHHHAYE